MPTQVSVNNLTVVHKASSGLVTFMPDVCLTPAPPAPPIPIPYPNIAMSQDTSQGSTTVKVDGNPVMLQGSLFSQSTGDEAGTNGGVVSGVTRGKAEFVAYSFDVSFEGKPVPRLGDMMLGNKGAAPNTPPMSEIQPPAPAVALDQSIKLSPDKIKIKVLDAAGKPMDNIRYIIKLPDGSKKEGKTDSAGLIEVDETISGIAQVIFPDHKEFDIRSKD
jgi:hypothetical protein